MIILNEDLKRWLKYQLKEDGRDIKKIADEIGVKASYLIKIVYNKQKVGANAVIKILKYLNYPDLDKLNLEDKKINKRNERGSEASRIKSCLEKHKLTLKQAGEICGLSYVTIFAYTQPNIYLTKKRADEIISKIETAMANRGK